MRYYVLFFCLGYIVGTVNLLLLMGVGSCLKDRKKELEEFDDWLKIREV